MRNLSFALVLGCCVCGLSAQAAQNAPPARATAPQTSMAGGGYWCRATNGSWVWVAPRSDATTLRSPASKPPEGKTGMRVETYYRPPNTIMSYPDEGRPTVINGIDWYLNGRSYFSD